jgi:transcriptional regulator with PAS, ATPase and Fis domain
MNAEGKFKSAHGGTLFLDEVGEFSTEIQAKLLRAVQEHIIEPLGSKTSTKVDVRLVAATNCDLKEAVAKGEFRDDLYYRLSVGEVCLPPLRQRPSDITKLAIHFLDKFNLQRRKPKRFAPEALGALQAHAWPGNVRELQNVVQRAVLLGRKEEIGPSDLNIGEVNGPVATGGCPDPYAGFSLEGHLKELRRHLFERALQIAEGNQSRAAKLLGLSPQAVFKFVKERQPR